ncbi:MAG TPA: hypothetical protein VF070_06900 [Streptosporangiaceae bacterium]
MTKRALAASTVRIYSQAAGLLAAQDGLRSQSLTADEVTGSVLARCQDRSIGLATVLVTELRSLLRYLHLARMTTVSLADATPSAATASPAAEGDRAARPTFWSRVIAGRPPGCGITQLLTPQEEQIALLFARSLTSLASAAAPRWHGFSGTATEHPWQRA